MSIYEQLTDDLLRRRPEVPDSVEVVSLAPVADDLPRRLLGDLGEAAGLDFLRSEPVHRTATTVFRDELGGRATLFHASGAIAVRTAIPDFDETFDGDPGGDRLSSLTQDAFAKLGVDRFVHPEDALDFERLWRILAAGADPRHQAVEPVLVRAIGAFRHQVRGLGVLGRASAHVELTGAGNVSAFSFSLRRLADQASEVLAKASTRPVEEAASEIAKQVARLTGGSEDAALVADSFGFGYLALGRRRAQAVLAPMYLAAISIAPLEGKEGQTKSAHVIAVPGSPERFLKLPSAAAAARTRRAA